MTTCVEWEGSLFYDFSCGRSTRGKEACTDPLDQGVVCDIVCTHHHDPLTATETDPIRGHRHSLSGAGTRGIGLSIRTLSPNVLSKL